MPTLYFFHFRYFDTMRNKWLTAPYAAEREVIAERYARYELIGEPEVRHTSNDWHCADASHLARGCS